MGIDIKREREIVREGEKFQTNTYWNKWNGIQLTGLSEDLENCD